MIYYEFYCFFGIMIVYVFYDLFDVCQLNFDFIDEGVGVCWRKGVSFFVFCEYFVGQFFKFC